MREVAFDESGNSGQNLLDPVQPVYTLASVARQADEVSSEVSALLVDSAYEELKFSEMRRNAEGRSILDHIFAGGLLDPEYARAVPVQKEWMVAGKMVDLLWEPGAANTNYFYASGMHRQLSDALFLQGPEDAGAETWERWQRAFLSAVRRPLDCDLRADLVAALADVKAAAAGTPVGILFEAVPDDAEALAELIPDGRDELDPAMTGLVEQIDHWSERLAEPFRVVHDDSNVVDRWRDVYLRFSDQTNRPSRFEVGDITFTFPLLAVEIETVESHYSSSVQLADVLSGAVTWCLRERVHGNEVPEQWWKWDLGAYIDFFQGSGEFLLGLVSAEGGTAPRPDGSDGPV